MNTVSEIIYNSQYMFFYLHNNNNTCSNNNNNNNNNNNFIFRKVTFKFYVYTYTREFYLKKAFVNKHDIIDKQSLYM